MPQIVKFLSQKRESNWISVKVQLVFTLHTRFTKWQLLIKYQFSGFRSKWSYPLLSVQSAERADGE